MKEHCERGRERGEGESDGVGNRTGFVQTPL
jgi:hypothetical protein